MSSTLAITGATGFLGRALVEECLHRPDLQVRVLARDPAAAASLWEGRGVHVHRGDLHEPTSLDGFVVPGATVVHLAFLKGGREANLDAVRALTDSSLGAGARRVVHCSTAALIGPAGRGLISESFVARPCGEYEEAKLAIEVALRDAVVPRAELAILRPTEIIGPGGEGLRAMISRLRGEPGAMRAIRGSILGARRFNYVSVRNVVEGLLLLSCATLPLNGEVFYLSDDDDADNFYASVEALILEALGRGGTAPRRAMVPLGVLSLLFGIMRNHAPPDRMFSTSKISSLGYRKVSTLRDTIKEVVEFEIGRSRLNGDDRAHSRV